jgi:hypothetical protein
MELSDEQRLMLRTLRDQLLDVLTWDVSLKRHISQTVGGLEDRLGLTRTIPSKEERRRQNRDNTEARGYADSYKVEHYIKR